MIESTRVEASALGLVSLKLEDRGTWNPSEQCWGEDGELIEERAKPIIAEGPRREFEMEQVLPGRILKIYFPIPSRNLTSGGNPATQRGHTEC